MLLPTQTFSIHRMSGQCAAACHLRTTQGRRAFQSAAADSTNIWHGLSRRHEVQPYPGQLRCLCALPQDALDREPPSGLRDGEQLQEPLLNPPSYVTSPAFFLASLAGFVLITADLFAPWGYRLLQHTIDTPTHLWVVEHLPGIVRDFVFELGISNVAITLGCMGWVLVSSVLFSDYADSLGNSSKGVRDAEAEVLEGVSGKRSGLPLRTKNVIRLASAWALYWSSGGFLVPGDNFLVRAIKHTFNRVRPSARHQSFSFPSGHATAVAFICGMLLFALLPWLLERAAQIARQPNSTGQGLLQNPWILRLARGAVLRGGLLWPTGIVSTALGRILGDVHWVTDTLAGACLGCAIVSGFLIICRQLELRPK